MDSTARVFLEIYGAVQPLMVTGQAFQTSIGPPSIDLRGAYPKRKEGDQSARKTERDYSDNRQIRWSEGEVQVRPGQRWPGFGDPSRAG